MPIPLSPEKLYFTQLNHKGILQGGENKAFPKLWHSSWLTEGTQDGGRVFGMLVLLFPSQPCPPSHWGSRRRPCLFCWISQTQQLPERICVLNQVTLYGMEIIVSHTCAFQIFGINLINGQCSQILFPIYVKVNSIIHLWAFAGQRGIFFHFGSFWFPICC